MSLKSSHFFAQNGFDAWVSVRGGTKNIAEARTLVYVIRRNDRWMSLYFIDRADHNRKRVMEIHDLNLDKALDSVSK